MLIYFAGGGDQYRKIAFEEGINTILLTYADFYKNEDSFEKYLQKLDKMVEEANANKEE